MKKLLLATVFATSFAMPNAFAENNNNSIGLYAGLDAGYLLVKDMAQQEADRIVNTSGGTASVVQATGTGVGRIFVGYTINKNFSVELGWLRSGDLKTTLVGLSGDHVAYSQTSTITKSGGLFAEFSGRME